MSNAKQTAATVVSEINAAIGADLSEADGLFLAQRAADAAANAKVARSAEKLDLAAFEQRMASILPQLMNTRLNRNRDIFDIYASHKKVENCVQENLVNRIHAEINAAGR